MHHSRNFAATVHVVTRPFVDVYVVQLRDPVNRLLFSAQDYLNGTSNILVCLLSLKSTPALFTLQTVSTREEPSQMLYILTKISQENIFRHS